MRNFVKQNIPLYPNAPSQSPMEVILLRDPHKTGDISNTGIYEKRSQWAGTTTVEHLKSAWQDDLGGEIAEEQWQTALKRIHSSSVCATHGLLQFKIIHRLHWSKQKLNKIFPEIPSCDRCGLTPASLWLICSGAARRYQITGKPFSRPYQQFYINILP